MDLIYAMTLHKVGRGPQAEGPSVYGGGVCWVRNTFQDSKAEFK